MSDLAPGEVLVRRPVAFPRLKQHYVLEDSRGTELARTVVTGVFERSVITIGATQYTFRKKLCRNPFVLMNSANSEPVLTTRITKEAKATRAITPITFRGRSLSYYVGRSRRVIIADGHGADALTVTGSWTDPVGHAIVGPADLGDDLPLIASAGFILFFCVMAPPFTG